MSIKDVTALRRSGNLEEAYALAQKDLNEDPNEWTRMSMFWVLRDIVQNRLIPENRIDKAKVGLKHMKSLLPRMMDENGAGERAYQKLYKSILPNADKIKSASELSKTDPNKAYNDITVEFGVNGTNINDALHEDFGWIIYRYMKANSETMQSLDVRKLLRDYMNLKNERPSLLHSMILNFALNFSKGHEDFNLYKFLLMWGIENLRDEDFQDGYGNQGTIPSLISRICRAIIESEKSFDVKDFIGKFSSHCSIVLECLRQAYFWKLMDLHRNGNLQALMSDFNAYAITYSCFGASHWHSEILKLANIFMIDSFSSRFVSFFISWNDRGNLRNEDWKKVTDDKGDEYPSLALRSAKKCFDLFKQNPNFRQDESALTGLKNLYAKVKEHDTDDDWSIRNYATICIWIGDVNEAIAIYKKLLVHNGDKYYMWSELADCVTDNNLRIGLLLNAKKLEKNEDFLGNIHLALADACLKEGDFEMAKNELETYAKHYAEKKWRLADAYFSIDQAIQKCSTTNKKINIAELITTAEDFIYSDYEWKEFVLTEKRIHNDKITQKEIEYYCNFTDGDKLKFSIKTKRFPLLKKAKVGDIVSFRCSVKEEKVPDPKYSSWQHRYITKYKVIPFLAKKSESKPWSLLPIKHEIVVVDDVNNAKELFHISMGAERVGAVVRFVQTDIRPFVGQFLEVDYYIHENKDEKKLIKIVEIQETSKVCENITKEIAGRLEVKYKNDGWKYKDDEHPSLPDFAFVDGYYVHSSVLRKYNVLNDCNVTAKLVLGSDNKWKVYDLVLLEAYVLHNRLQ